MYSFHLKYQLSTYLKEDDKRLFDYLLSANHELQCVITTNKIIGEPDKFHPDQIVGLKDVSMVFAAGEGKIIRLFGSLEAFFQSPFGGSFFVKGAHLNNTAFESVKGVLADVTFTLSYPTQIDEMKKQLNDLRNEPLLVFNLSQFDDFMNLFTYYKDLSFRLNNTASYQIISISDPYFFMPISVKELPAKMGQAIYDNDGIIIGHRLRAAEENDLPSEIKDEGSYLCDIKIAFDATFIHKYKGNRENLYLSLEPSINDKNVNSVFSLDPVNLVLQDETIVLSVQAVTDIDWKYLLIYDMGQKIKIESIEESLKMINQGASGAAADLLTYLIGDATMPNIGNVPLVDPSPYIKGLNASQIEAFYKAIDGSPVTLIKGPPGTGKTHVINAVTQYIVKALKEKVIISSQTHVAIDNVLDGLMSNREPVIPNLITNNVNHYDKDHIDGTLYKTWGLNVKAFSSSCPNQELAESINADLARFEGEQTINFAAETPESGFSVIGATTTTSAIGGRRGLEKLKGYDWLIIDEVSKCPITEVLRYLPYVKRIILVGDDFQLSPLLEFSKEDVKDFDIYDGDKFEKLRSIYENSVFAKVMQKAIASNRLVTLNENYRSVKAILEAYNVFYNGTLIDRRDSTDAHKVAFDQSWPALNERDIFFVEVRNGKEVADENSHSRYNVEELRATAYFLKTAYDKTIHPETVTMAAIFPYAAQISRFTKQYKDLINACRDRFKSFEVDTVDAFQGRQCDIVLVDTVVTDSQKHNFLSDFRRINVSLSRARDKLIIFGNSNTLGKITMSNGQGEERCYFNEIIERIRHVTGQVFEFKGEEGIDYAPKSAAKIRL